MQPPRLTVGPIGAVSPDAYCSGSGTEGVPFVSGDNAAGIQTAIAALAAWRGGAVGLSVARYNVTAADGIRITSPSIAIVSPVAGFNVDPNGLSEGVNGSKIHTTTHGVRIGLAATKLGGILLRDLYLWGPAVTGSHDGVTIDVDTDQPRLENLNLSNFAKAINITSVCDAGHFSGLCILGNGYGVYIDTTGNAGYTKIYGCEISDNSNSGVVDLSSATDYLRIENCTLVRNANVLTANGANVYLGSDFAVILGCTVRDAGHDLLHSSFAVASGIIVASDFCVVSGNVIAANQTGAGINLIGNWNKVVANSFGEGNAFDVVVQGTGNTVDAPESPSVIDAGADSIITRVPNLLNADTIAGWSTFMASLTAGQTDPTGGTGAVKITPNTQNNFHSAFQAQVQGGSQGSIFCVLAHSAGYDWIKLTMQISGTDRGGWVNLSNGVKGTVDGGITLQVLPLATSGWYAILIFSTSTSTVLGINVGNADNAGSWTGNGTDGVLIWRPYAVDTERQ